MHFHYVLSMGVVFGMMGGTYYWIGKVTGYQYPETLGKIHFWLMFIGVNKLAPFNLAWCWDNCFQRLIKIFVDTLTNIKSNQLLRNWENLKRTNIKNVNVKNNLFQIVNQQGYVRNFSTAPQRIHAKELAYLIGLFEADGSLSCYMEKQHVRVDLVIVLEEKDAKLTHWIKNYLGFGSVRFAKYSYDPTKKVTRYMIRSKRTIIDFFFPILEEYYLCTKNKNGYYNWVKKCLERNEVLSKKDYLNDISLQKNISNNSYIKDWIIGFIEGNGSFYIIYLPNGSSRAEFNISKKNEEKLLEEIGKIMGLSGKNKVSKKSNGLCILTSTSLLDVQMVVNFMCNSERVKLKGLKKVKFLLWLRELRRNPRYSGLKIPNKY